MMCRCLLNSEEFASGQSNRSLLPFPCHLAWSINLNWTVTKITRTDKNDTHRMHKFTWTRELYILVD